MKQPRCSRDPSHRQLNPFDLLYWRRARRRLIGPQVFATGIQSVRGLGNNNPHCPAGGNPDLGEEVPAQTCDKSTLAHEPASQIREAHITDRHYRSAVMNLGPQAAGRDVRGRRAVPQRGSGSVSRSDRALSRVLLVLLALPNRGLDLLNDPVQMVEVAQRAASASYMNADANRADLVAYPRAASLQRNTRGDSWRCLKPAEF